MGVKEVVPKIVGRARGGHGRSHPPAHSLPPVERRKLKATHSHRMPAQHAAGGRLASTVLFVRQDLAQPLARLIRVIQAPRIPDVGADMLVTCHESVWQRGARMARTPAFGLAVITYLAAAGVVSAAISPLLAEGPAAGGAGPAPPMGLNIVPVSSSGSGLTGASGGPASADVRVDPHYLANLQKVFGDLGGPVVAPRPRDQHYGFGDEPRGPAPGPVESVSVDAPPPDAPPPDAPARDTAPDAQPGLAPTTALPSGQQSAGPPPSSAPASATVPDPPASGDPNG
ncbi:hypothetical protein ABIA30_005131 [Mycobacterium sp. MAA66]